MIQSTPKCISKDIHGGGQSPPKEKGRKKTRPIRSEAPKSIMLGYGDRSTTRQL